MKKFMLRRSNKKENEPTHKDKNVFLKEALKVLKYTLASYVAVFLMGFAYLVNQSKAVSSQEALNMIAGEVYSVISAIMAIITVISVILVISIAVKQAKEIDAERAEYDRLQSQVEANKLK